MTSTLNASYGDVKAEATILKGSKSQDLPANLEIQGRYRQRRRPPHSKRRDSRHSKPLSKSQAEITSSDEDEMNTAHEELICFLEEAGREVQDKKSSTLNASDGDAMVEVKIMKQPAAKKVVEPMASTAFMSDSDEERIVVVHEQYIRLLEEAGREIQDKLTLNAIDGDVKALQQPAAKGSKAQDLAADLEIPGRCGSQRRRPPHSKRRDSRHSKPWSKPRFQFSSITNEEELFLAHEELIRLLEETVRVIHGEKSSTLNASDGDVKAEAMILPQPAAN